jgi:transposase
MTLTTSDMSSAGSKGLGVFTDKKSGTRAGQATRRVFGPAYKLAIVDEYDALTVHGSRGALLRREGLYQSHVDKWRRARDRGALTAGNAAETTKPAKAKDARHATGAENRRLVAENARLTAELANSKAVTEIVGKLHALLESLSESAE